MTDRNSFKRTETLRLRIAAQERQAEDQGASERPGEPVASSARDASGSEYLFEELFESVYDAVFITQMDGMILRQNEQARRHFGIADESVCGTNILDLILGADAGHLASVRERLNQQGRVWIEADCAGPECESFPAEITANVIHFTGQSAGELCFFIRDTSAQTQAEEELATERYLMNQLMEQSNDRIYFKDCDGRFVRVSRQWLNSVGLDKAEEALGKTEADFFDAQHVKEVVADDQQIIETGKPILNKVERLNTPDRGGVIWLSTNKGPLISSDGSIVGTFGVSRNITTQKHYEQTLAEQNALMETDLRVAREIQQAFIQHDIPTFPSDSGEEDSAFQFWTYYLPSGAIGGDFFDITRLSESSAGVWICDVMGHDVRAALIMASLHGLSEKMEAAASDPGQFLTEVNSSMCSILDRAGTLVFTSAFYMVLDAAAGKIFYANAGHAPPFYRYTDKESVTSLGESEDSQAPALGLFRDTVYVTHEQDMRPGDQITLFTDGLHEVHDNRGEPYGLSRLQESFSQQRKHSPSAFFPHLIDKIRAYSENGEFEDDVCLVNVCFSGYI